MNNPLATSQRETSGAMTFGKYEYQYHWALCRILSSHENACEYALFMEYHEDVVISDSLNKDTAKFEFNQVKNIASPKYNINNMTKQKKGTGSVLGKLVQSVINKPFEKKVSTINLIASCGFNIDQVDNNKNLDVITTGDLSTSSVAKLTKALKNELGIKKIPKNLCFIIPDLGITNQQDAVIGRISKLVTQIFPNSHCNADNIYRILIDELHRKGTVHYDYNDWDKLLKNKALTSEKVAETISTHVKVHNMQEILLDANDVSKELGFTFLQQKRFRRSIERIHMKTIGFPSALSLKVRKSIKSILPSAFEKSGNDLMITVTYTLDNLPKEIKRNLGDQESIRNHVLYEIIVSN